MGLNLLNEEMIDYKIVDSGLNQSRMATAQIVPKNKMSSKLSIRLDNSV